MYFDIIQPIPENITSDDLFNKLSGCDLPPGHHLIKYEFYKIHTNWSILYKFK